MVLHLHFLLQKFVDSNYASHCSALYPGTRNPGPAV
nr:MAG TPA: hypothetical protein [Caudoviricetes sp.]DAZ83551.1 MAG TPA: hypothetical protein [Caudoviricetes sp.]